MQGTQPELWLPQKRGIHLVTEALSEGWRRILLVAPTGAGKSRTANELIRDWLHVGFNVSLYTNRKMLLRQLARSLGSFGFKHGTRSASAIESGKLPSDEPLQISTVQTEASRVLRKKTWQLHKADRIIVDEAHLNSGDTVKALLELHLAAGGSYVGLTATPVGLGELYDHMCLAGSVSDLRDCGALVMARHYGCEEPDTSKIRKTTVEMTDKDVQRTFQEVQQQVVSCIFKRFDELNPDRKPTILFAPGVPESIWFCEKFRERGIEAAHIDGKTCCYKGERHDSDDEIRDEIIRAFNAGEVKVLCNRFVLREGIDIPGVEHMILATIMNSISSYLQSVGRGLRASPKTGKTHLTIQDHGGHWWRHGSVNANREWDLEMEESTVANLRAERIRNHQEPEPKRCQKCGMITVTGRCQCGYRTEVWSRPVVMADGRIVEHKGKIFTERPTKSEPTTGDLWRQMYYRSKNSDRTFLQAYGFFYHENGYWPPKDLMLMPTNERDWMRRVKDVPREKLS